MYWHFVDMLLPTMTICYIYIALDNHCFLITLNLHCCFPLKNYTLPIRFKQNIFILNCKRYDLSSDNSWLDYFVFQTPDKRIFELTAKAITRVMTARGTAMTTYQQSCVKEAFRDCFEEFSDLWVCLPVNCHYTVFVDSKLCWYLYTFYQTKNGRQKQLSTAIQPVMQ